MNQIIQRLSEVETAASSIIEEAGAKKKQMAKDQALKSRFMKRHKRKSALSRQSLKKRSLKNLKLRRRSLKNSLLIWTVFMRKAIRRSPDSCWQRLWRNNFYGIISVVPKKSYEKGLLLFLVSYLTAVSVQKPVPWEESS